MSLQPESPSHTHAAVTGVRLPAPLRRGLERYQLAARSIYGLVGFPVGLFWFIVAATTLSTSLSLSLVLVGLPLLSLNLRLLSVSGSVERWLLKETLDITIEAPERVVPSGNSVNWFSEALRDPSRWRETVWACTRLFTGLASFVIVLFSLLYPIFGLSTLFWGWFVFDFWVLFVLITGICWIAIGPLLIVGITELQISLARSLLGPTRTSLESRTEQALTSRSQTVEAAEAERRRIERDLHDGAQARLATVALDLGRAKRRIEQGAPTDEVGDIVDQAHLDAKTAIVELRNLARGIHPAVLTDRGLDAALSEVAASCAVDTRLDVHLESRPPAHVESTAYFTVCELLANVSRHSGASRAWVTVRGDRQRLTIEVSDDGVGGVDPRLGTGIAGLRDRLAGVDGELILTSPLGGGTSAIIEIPAKGLS